jgi:hypothetical protein
MIVGGWVQHDQIQAIAPQIQEWYHSEGHKRLPSLTQWLAQRAAMPTYTEQEKRYNFIEMNPKWAMLGNGEVLQPEISYQLPRRQGVHIVGGVIRLHGDTADRDAVFEMESMQGIVQKVLRKRFKSYVNLTKEKELGILVGCEHKKILSYRFNGCPMAHYRTIDTTGKTRWSTQNSMS